jgi:hypothetical protein
MIAKFIATQAIAVVLGVIGAGLIENAIDKSTRQNYYRNVVVFPKLYALKG